MTTEAIAIIVAGGTMAIGSIGPALGEARAAASAFDAMGRQPDLASTIQRTLLISMALIITPAPITSEVWSAVVQIPSRNSSPPPSVQPSSSRPPYNNSSIPSLVLAMV